MKKYHLILLLGIILLSSCVTQRRCSDKFPQVSTTNIKDSTVITHETRYYDSIIYKVVEIPKLVKRDSVVIRYENGQAVTDRLYLKGRYSEAIAYLDGSRLKGQLTESGWLTVEMKLKLQEKTIKELQSKTTETVKIVPQKYVPGFVKLLAWVGGLFLLLILLFIAYKVAKVYFKVSFPFLKS